MTVGTVALVTLGCGRNEVDSDQVGGALESAGFRLVDDPSQAECVLVNTCTFIAPAREESVETVLGACDLPARVVVMGCMAQRYGQELADAVPEAAAVVSFADYPRLPEIVARVLGRDLAAAAPTAIPGPGPAAMPTAVPGPGPADRQRAVLPLLRDGGAPRHAAAPRSGPAPTRPPTATFPVRTAPRGPWAYVKIAGGCDRVCTFCTIPSYRGRFRSRPADELVAEVRWLTEQGVREIVCVSENTTSWGKDLAGGRREQIRLIRAFERIEGLARVRLLYLQPAEIIPELLDAMAASPVVAGYYDLSLQHAAPGVVAAMGRSGGAERFLELIRGIRARDPHAVFRSSFITGFPGETEDDVALLEDFLVEARLDWAGFFTFSPEDGTPAAALPDQVSRDEAEARRAHLVDVAEGVAEAQAETFVGRTLEVLVESHDGADSIGRSYREAPETDGEVRLPACEIPVGRIVPVTVAGTYGVDLLGAPVLAAHLERA